jgi:hypothetical protein
VISAEKFLGMEWHQQKGSIIVNHVNESETKKREWKVGDDSKD